MITRRHTHSARILLAVATAATAGCGSTEPAVDATAVGPGGELTVVATDMAFTPDELEVSAGDVAITLVNEGQAYHDLRVGEEPFIVEVAAGGSATVTVNLAAGTYEMFCSIPGHSEAGMVGTLVVR